MIKDIPSLLQAADLGSQAPPTAGTATATFPVRVPPRWLQRMRPAMRRIRCCCRYCHSRMKIEKQKDLSPTHWLKPRPRPVPGILHKYHGRALLITTGACDIHCRYCFRRHYPYTKDSGDGFEQALGYLAADPALHEIILSGGDPLTLSMRRLAALLRALDNIPHLRTLRIHSRSVIVRPERVSLQLLDLLSKLRLRRVLVTHANHARELGADLKAPLAALRAAGVTLLNQAVLLKGINDTIDTQIELAEALFELQILPYYLHQLDAVAGAAHYRVSEYRARQLMRALRQRLPGYLVARLVREQAGAKAKQILL